MRFDDGVWYTGKFVKFWLHEGNFTNLRQLSSCTVSSTMTLMVTWSTMLTWRHAAWAGQEKGADGLALQAGAGTQATSPSVQTGRAPAAAGTLPRLTAVHRAKQTQRFQKGTKVTST